MKKIAFFDAKPYDKIWFDKTTPGYEIIYCDARLDKSTAKLAEGCEVVCAFVNDEIDKSVIDTLYKIGVRLLAMRCAGYSNVDFKSAYNKINVVRVPAYSPHAVAEHAMAVLQTLNRRIHKAYIRTRDFNFSLNGLTGIDLCGKTAGIIGTGKIGRVLIDICRGYGMNILAYDKFPAKDAGYEYVELDELLSRSDVVSIHCPLTEETFHMLDEKAFKKMKKGAFLINTSRGALVNSEALLAALNDGTLRGAGLDVYEEEADFFFRDLSESVLRDDLLATLISLPNVIITSHQAFLTEEALESIARTTYANIDEFFSGGFLTNEVCYQCDTGKITENCRNARKERCF
ncbi:MAG: 2-hydroxyacid dehydrogenase [Ruminococcaceae bacterium]|nr:2-hydroxyacid dehydrogenase [Oscillospiraceae bacterium]